MATREKVSSPTINDIALACGVSKATVSYVLNGKRTLRSDTRERVFRTMREMNYHPSAVARGLSQKRVHTLGILFGAVDPVVCLSDPYAAGLLSGVIARCQNEGFNLTLFTQKWKNFEESSAPLRDGRTDGVLVVAPQLDSGIIEGLAQFNVPIVAVSARPCEGVAVVDVDNFAGAKMATRHLLELGHRRIAYLSGNQDLASYAPRRAGFEAALAEAGIQVDPELVLVSQFDGAKARQQTLHLLGLPTPPTAIFAGNDTIAFSVLETAREQGIVVPDQLSVIGFDDQPLAARLSPALSTIRQPLHALGDWAARLLLELTRSTGENKQPDPIFLAPELIVRESTAPMPN